MLLEVCVDSVESAIAAEKGGANRLELCASLKGEGGITPSIGLLRQVLSKVKIPVMVMVRPRGGDFVYNADELDVMRADIEAIKGTNAAGIVLGALSPNGTVDKSAMESLLSGVRPLPVTFHRAIDMTSDVRDSLQVLIELGVERVLTSGGKQSASIGTGTLRKLVADAGDKIIVMPGCGINEDNLAPLCRTSNATEYHVSASESFDSPMEFRNSDVAMGSSKDIEYARYRASEERVEMFTATLTALQAIRDEEA